MKDLLLSYLKSHSQNYYVFNPLSFSEAVHYPLRGKLQ